MVVPIARLLFVGQHSYAARVRISTDAMLAVV